MDNNRQIKQKIVDLILEIQEKITDREYKDLLELVAQIQPSICVECSLLPPKNESENEINIMPSVCELLSPNFLNKFPHLKH